MMNVDLETSEEERDCATSRQVFLGLGDHPRDEELSPPAGKRAKSGSGLRDASAFGGRKEIRHVDSIGTLQHDASTADSGKANGTKRSVPSTALWRRSMSHQDDSKGGGQDQEATGGQLPAALRNAPLGAAALSAKPCQVGLQVRTTQRAGWPAELERSQPLKLWPLYDGPKTLRVMSQDSPRTVGPAKGTRNFLAPATGCSGGVPRYSSTSGARAPSLNLDVEARDFGNPDGAQGPVSPPMPPIEPTGPCPSCPTPNEGKSWDDNNNTTAKDNEDPCRDAKWLCALGPPSAKAANCSQEGGEEGSTPAAALALPTAAFNNRFEGACLLGPHKW